MSQNPPPDLAENRKNQNEITDPYPTTFRQGVLMGFTLGALLAFWYAPRSGAENLARLEAWLEAQQAEALARLEGWRATLFQILGVNITSSKRESIEDSLAAGRAMAHRHRAEQAQRISDTDHGA